MDLFPNFRTTMVENAVKNLASAEQDERGAVYTKEVIVEFILDLVGYQSSKEIFNKKILEPSFGQGDFLKVIVKRVLKSYQKYGIKKNIFEELRNAIRAVEVHEISYTSTQKELYSIFELYGIPSEMASELLSEWLICDDFLLHEFKGKFDFIVGNPPYIRQELIPEALLQEYKRRFKTIYDRADLYIPFIENALRLLMPKGRVGYICSDRWVKNKYGRPLRKLISQNYSLEYHVDMVGADAFHYEVSAYTSIYVIANKRNGKTMLSGRPPINKKALKPLAHQMTSGIEGSSVIALTNATPNDGPWILGYLNELSVIRRLEDAFPAIEDVGCKIGIGVATGCDRAYIAMDEDLPIEDDRKEPILMAPDIRTGKIKWAGKYVVNPFCEDGSLVSLNEYPMLRSYLESRKEEIKCRNVAKRNPDKWFRTIDRIYPQLTRTPKLLIPDIKGEANVVYDDGKFYPHHNLYYVKSDSWPLEALRLLLKSSVALAFIQLYSVKMRGGYLRFQAQYLRRLRIPQWSSLSLANQELLTTTMNNIELSRAEIDEVVFPIYSLEPWEAKIIKSLNRNDQ